MIKFYDRTAYLLFVMDIPHLKGRELLSAVRIKLSGIYPGNLSEHNIQIRKNRNKKNSHLVFVLDKNTGNVMLPLSPLFIQHVFSNKSANVLYIDKRWMDYTRVENGAILSSTVKIRDNTRLIDDVNELCGTDEELVICCGKADLLLLDSLNAKGNIRFVDSRAELNKTDVHKISLFSDKSTSIKIKRVLAAAVVLLLLVVCSGLLYSRNKNEHEQSAALRLEQENLKEINRQRQLEEQKLLELKQQYQEIISSKKVTPFDMAAVIAECAGQNTRIRSATFNGSFFQFEGVSDNPLELLNRFEAHRLVGSARLHQVHPAGGGDNFTLSGTVLAEITPVDDFPLPVNEQIVKMEELIEIEQSYTSGDNSLSPSVFGGAVKSLFQKWGCTVNSYQFMNEAQKTEVEYSISSPGTGFFNALYDIKTNRRSWDIYLVQVRNLYPRNMLDIVLRVRTEYRDSNSGKKIGAPSIPAAGPYPVANISRNYFPPAPAPGVSQLPVIAREPPVVVIPARAERVSWLEYVGSVSDAGNNRLIYIKDTRTGEIFRLGQYGEGNMRYALSPSGSITAYINNHIYEINRR
jgi:hypothetical protein